MLYGKEGIVTLEEVMFLILEMMPCKEVAVWKDIKYSTLPWRDSWKNTKGQSGEAEVRILMINLRGVVAKRP